MRFSTRRAGDAGVALERLRALLGHGPLDGLPDGLGPPASFGGPPAVAATRPTKSAGERPTASPRVPPAALLRSSPRSPDDSVEEPAAHDPVPLAGRAGTLADRFSPGLPGARALAVVGVLTALVAGGYLWSSRPRPQPVAGLAAPSVAAPAVSGSPSSAATVVVHVAGKVRRPGVVTLTAGARVSEAVGAAGGLRPGAGIGSLNLARRVVDGERILVPMPAAGGPAAFPGPPPSGGVPGTQLDLNAATIDQFQQLPGVGPVLAQRIVDHRTRIGAFRSVEQLREVSGIGARRFTDLKDLVRV